MTPKPLTKISVSDVLSIDEEHEHKTHLDFNSDVQASVKNSLTPTGGINSNKRRKKRHRKNNQQASKIFSQTNSQISRSPSVIPGKKEEAIRDLFNPPVLGEYGGDSREPTCM